MKDKNAIDITSELVSVVCIVTNCKYNLRWKGYACCGLKNITITEEGCKQKEVKEKNEAIKN